MDDVEASEPKYQRLKTSWRRQCEVDVVRKTFAELFFRRRRRRRRRLRRRRRRCRRHRRRCCPHLTLSFHREQQLAFVSLFISTMIPDTQLPKTERNDHTEMANV